MLESKFQADLKKELERMFPGCIVLKNNPNQIQGIPDLIVIFKDKWAFLECKKSKTASARPNQSYYVDYGKENCFGSFIYPENKEEVLHELQQTFGVGR